MTEPLLPQLTTRSYCYKAVPDKMEEIPDPAGKDPPTKIHIGQIHGGLPNYCEEEFALRRRLVEEARQRVKLEDVL